MESYEASMDARESPKAKIRAESRVRKSGNYRSRRRARRIESERVDRRANVAGIRSNISQKIYRRKIRRAAGAESKWKSWNSGPDSSHKVPGLRWSKKSSYTSDIDRTRIRARNLSSTSNTAPTREHRIRRAVDSNSRTIVPPASGSDSRPKTSDAAKSTKNMDNANIARDRMSNKASNVATGTAMTIEYTSLLEKYSESRARVTSLDRVELALWTPAQELEVRATRRVVLVPERATIDPTEPAKNREYPSRRYLRRNERSTSAM